MEVKNLKRKTKNTNKDKFGTLMLVFAILSGFWLISYVNASYENDNSSVQLFDSDSGTNFLTLNYPTGGIYDVRTSGVYDGIANYSKTPVYLGNSTWSFTSNFTDEAGAFSWFIMEIPNLDKWVIDNITFELKVVANPDIYVSAQIISGYELDEVTPALDSNNYIFEEHHYDGITDGIYYNETVELSLAETLSIYSDSQNGVQHYMIIKVTDDDGDGNSEFAFSMKVEITGNQVATYNIIQQLELASGLYLIILGITFILTNDEIDIGGYVNDIPNKKRRK